MNIKKRIKKADAVGATLYIAADIASRAVEVKRQFKRMQMAEYAQTDLVHRIVFSEKGLLEWIKI